jgi:hypothetical protein
MDCDHVKSTIGVAIASVALLLGGVVVTQAGASTHPTYPLGSAKTCKAHYVKKILPHKVKGKTESYIECVYVPAKNATTSTTTGATPEPNKAAFQVKLGKWAEGRGLMIPNGVWCAFPRAWSVGTKFDCFIEPITVSDAPAPTGSSGSLGTFQVTVTTSGENVTYLGSN